MKKILAIILAVLMCISSVAMIASCSNKNTGDEDVTQAPTQENTTPTQTEQPTEAPSEETTTKGEEETTEEPLPELTPIEEAMAYIHQLYKDSLTDTGNYDLIKAVKIGDVTFAVEWTITGTDAVTITEKNDTLLTVVVPKAEAEFTYTLTASITHEGETLTRDYVHTVPKFEVSGFADYMAAGKGDSVVVEGIITSISSKSEGDTYNNLYLQDLKGEGGYYIYAIKDGIDPVADLGLKLGMTVSVSGIKDIYNKVHEVKDAVIEIVDATEKAIEYIDITDIAKAASGADADALTNFQGCWVTVKGVEITNQNLAQYYYKWIIGNVDTYTRLALSCGLPAEVLDEIKAGHTAHAGYIADVKGIVNVYNGAFYLVPLGADAFTYHGMAEVADDVKVEREKNNLTVNATYTTTSALTLPVVGGTYNTVTIAWTSSNAEVATVAADGKVTFLKAGEVTFTATLTLGTATATATFTVTVETPKDPTPNSVLSIPQALEVAGTKEHDKYTEGKYYVIGTIKSIASDKYGNMTIVDANGNELYVYGTWSEDGNTRYDSLENKPQVGDTVKLYGILGKYNDTLQMKNGWIIPTTPVAPSQETIKITLGGKYVTATPYVYTSSSGSTKDQLVMSENAADAAVFTVIENADGSISFVVDGKFLYADGTNVRLVAEEGEFTKFVYEETDGGVFIRCFTANFNGKAQYLEVYKGYLTCYGMGSDTSIYTFVIEKVGGGSTTPDEPVTPPTPPTSEVTAVKPVVGTAYKLFMNQTKAGKVVFLDGDVSGYYLSTTENFASALDFYIEETTGGFYVYTMINGAKKYLNMVVSGTHVNAVYGDTASTVFTYNETIKTIVGIVNDAEYVFGTRNDNTYTTVGANALSYNPFMVQFTLAAGNGGSTEPDEPDTPAEPEGEKVDVKYTFSEMEAGEQYASENRVLDDNTTLITVDCHITTELRIYKAAAGGNAYSQWPAREGVAIIKSVKPLKNIVLNLGGKKTTFTISASVDGVTYVEVATIEVTSTDFSEFVVDLGDAGYKYVKLETAAQGRVKYFGLNFAEVTAEDFYVAEKPVEGTKYNFVLFQGAAEKFVLVNGLMDGYYMGTTTDAAAALNFYVEATEGGYYLYTMMNGYKIYLNIVVSGTHVNAKYEPTPSTVYTYDETLKTLVATVNEKTYAFGTRSDKTYTTIGPVVANQYDPFIAQFALSTNDDVAANEPKPGAPITTDDALDILANLPTYGATTTNKYGVKGTVVSVDGTTITIKDDNGNTLVIKNVLNATGSAAVEKMPVVGDTVVVLGLLTNIGGNAMVEAWLQSATTHTCDMTVATCKTPSTCTICGKVEGTVTAEHTGWVDATCAEAAHCTDCGTVEGEKLADCQGWVAPTCSEYGYCTVCGKVGTELDADNHANVIPATCREAAYCVDCENHIGEKDPTAHGEKTVATCFTPETCKLCGTTFGEVSGEHGTIENCVCTVCNAIVHTGELSVPTCMTPVTCLACNRVAGEKDADNHVGFAPATCIAPATCECGATQGAKDPDAHGELGAQCVCSLCKKAVHPAFDEECGCVDCGVVVHVFDKLYPTCTNGCGADNDHFLTVPEANDLGATKGNNAYTSDKYSVKGVITKIENTTYGNLYIKDESGREFYVYGVYSANGSTKFGSMSVQPKVGDTVILYGIIGKYSNNPQMKNGWMIAHEIHTVCEFTEATCQDPATCTICGKTQGTTVAHNYVDKFCTVCGTREGAVTVTGKYTGSSTGNMTLNTNNAAKIGLDANVFNVVPANGSSTSTVGLNKAGNFRLYGNANKNGNTLTFTVAENTVIQSITITFANTTNNANCQVSVGGTAVATSTSADKVFTVAINASEFVLKNVNASTTQVHITSIEITYYVVETEGGEVENPDVPEEETTTEAPTTEETTTEEETTVGGGEAVENVQVFDFSKNTTSASTTALTQSGLNSILNNCYSGDETFTTGSTVTYVYSGNTSSGDVQGKDFIKLGKSSGAAKFTIDFGDKKVSKVVVNCQNWTASKSNKLSINGSAQQIAPQGSKGDLTFELATPTGKLEFATTERIFVFSITVYFE